MSKCDANNIITLHYAKSQYINILDKFTWRMSYYANRFFAHLRTINNLCAFLLSCRSSPGQTGVEENANNRSVRAHAGRSVIEFYERKGAVIKEKRINI